MTQHRQDLARRQRVLQQQVFLNDHRPDYNHHPFFFSVCTYRYINLSQLLGLQPIR